MVQIIPSPVIADVTPALAVTCATPVPVIERVTSAPDVFHTVVARFFPREQVSAGFFQVVDVPALQILKDFHDEDIGFVPQELGKHCVGNFVPPEALILMNSFEKTNSHSPACVRRQADGHNFVSPGKRASEPDMIIPNTTSTRENVDKHECPCPSDPGTECGRYRPDFGKHCPRHPRWRL